MSELATLARPYAAAVFKRAKETGDTEKWSQALAFMATVMKDKDVASIVVNPKVSNDRLSALMLEICHEQVDKEGENFLKLLVHNKRLSLVSFIARIFEEYKAQDEGYIDTEVFTAYALTKEVKASLTSALEKSLSKKVHMNVIVDKSLIGGVLVRAGDRVIDGSIRGQLQQMQKALL